MSDQNVVSITAYNNKQLVPFVHLVITQQFNAHHFFELRFNNELIEEGSGGKIIDKAKSYLGKAINFSFKSPHYNYPDNHFKAIVSEIAVANASNGSSGEMIFRGYSPTLLLETGRHLASYSQTTLQDIAHKVLGNAAANLLQTQVQPAHSGEVPFVLQYHESNFEFMNRLARNYGEHFYYDGTQLLFGKPPSTETYHLEYPTEISELDLKMRVAPLTFQEMDHNQDTGEDVTAVSNSDMVEGLDAFGKFAANSAKSLFINPVLNFPRVKALDSAALEETVKYETTARAAGLVEISASSDFCYIKPGVHLSISAKTLTHNGTGGTGYSTEDLGKFMVTHVTHTIDGQGNYQNSFEAITATVAVPPATAVTLPVAEPQLGVVTSNEDPNNLGRVQVRLLWQKHGETTPWLRVMSLHSGGSNRGMFFLPEAGDHVMVGFTQNDPDRPFVMGSLPDGKTIDSSKNSDNNIKAIRTRSGNTIYLRDKEQSNTQEIMLKTDDKNTISISVNNGNGTINIASTKDINITSDSTVKVKSKNITVEAENSLQLKGQTIEITAQAELKMAGQSSVSLKSSGQLEVKAGAVASIQASLVKIN